MGTKLFIIVILIIYLSFLIYSDSIYLRSKEQECFQPEPLDDPAAVPNTYHTPSKETLEPEPALDNDKEIVSNQIENTLKQIQSPFYNDGSVDTDTKINNLRRIYSDRSRRAQIGNHTRSYTETFKKIHQPLLNHYDKMNWYERDSTRDFDMFLK